MIILDSTGIIITVKGRWDHQGLQEFTIEQFSTSNPQNGVSLREALEKCFKMPEIFPMDKSKVILKYATSTGHLKYATYKMCMDSYSSWWKVNSTPKSV